MINLLNEPIIADGLTAKKLRLHVKAACDRIKKQVRDNPSRALKRKLLLAEGVSNAVANGANPRSVMTSFCEIASNNARVNDEIVASCGYYSFNEGGGSRGIIRSFCRVVLYHAWCARDVVLPVNFMMRSTITSEMRVESPSMVLRALTSYRPEAMEIKKFGGHVQKWLRLYSLTWIYATNWIDFSDIKVDEAAQLHVYMSDSAKSLNGNPSSVGRAIQVFAERGYINVDLAEFESAKKASFNSQYRLLSLPKDRSNLKGLDPFAAPYRRLEGSYFYIHPQLEVDGFAIPQKVVELWDKLFNQYILYREQTGRTANAPTTKHFRTLADYISIALPMFAMHASEPIDIPVSPKGFTRYPFIDQTLRPRSFPTFLAYLERRGLAATSRKGVLYTIQDFFQWVELNLTGEDFGDISGPGYRCPIHNKDLPFHPRPSGTTKIPFTVDVYPILFLFIHEVERIGMYLEARPEIAEEICNFSSRKAGDHIVDLRNLDVEFNISSDGDLFRISQIPQRLLVGRSKAAAGINLGALRLLTLIIETGQRGQNAQWLDENSWAQHLHKYNDGDSTKEIHINTDKAGKPLDVRVLHRVVEMLKRQQDHRKAKGIPETVTNYEGREASPFEPLVPLFANEDGSVVSDYQYQSVWRDLLLGLQAFLFENNVEFKPLIRVKPPKEDDNGRTNADGLPMCELNWAPVQTPHSTRTSFVTRRAGSTEYVVLAELIGWADPMLAEYYDAVDYEEVIDVLDRQDRPRLDATSPISELRSQLTSAEPKKEDVIRRFGISSLRELHESETSSKDPKGIELLKSSQVSELVFRDTHICVVGEMCPDDVILAAGGPMRCGTCKLACKSVEHLPAIQAKCRSLLARIQATSAALMREKQGAGDRPRLRRLHNDLVTDNYQLVGWQDSSLTLHRLLEEKKAEGIVAGSPEIIKLHLKRVVRQIGPAQFLVDRIVDAKQYPSISDEVLQRQASRLARKLAMSDQEQDLMADENEEVLALYSLIKTRLKAAGMTWDDAGKLLEQEVKALIDEPKSEVRLLNASS